MPKSDLFDLEKAPLERFKQTSLLTVISTILGQLYAKNREKVIEQFWRK